MSSDRLMSVEELADYLGVSRSAIYGWRYRNTSPPAFRLGGGRGALRFRKADVDEWLADNAA